MANPKDGAVQRPPRKRGDGEGSIDEVREGLWRGRVMVGYKPDGKPDRRVIYGKTRAEVQRKLRELARQAEQGMLGDAEAGRVCVSAFLDRWLEAVQSTVGPRTYQRYAEVIRLHLLPELGRQRLAALRPDHLQALYARKLAAGQAAASVRKLHAVLHHALRDAVRWGYAPRNVADAVDAPAVRRPELQPPAPTELKRLIEAARDADDRLAVLWIVAVYTGCRQGELLGLMWRDLDLETGTLVVRRTLLRAKGREPLFGEPKTARSRRTVTLPAPAVAALKEQRERQDAERASLGADYAHFDLVFASGTGTPLLPRNVIRSFKLALARAGLPSRTRFHDLRHAAATMLLRAGVHPKVVSERLGHSTITLTLDTYTHVVPGLDADAAGRLERVMDEAN